VFGGQDYIGDYHYALYTPDSLSALLQGAGFRSVRVMTQGRRNGLFYEFEIAADKPGDALNEGEPPS
jgi:hypothetical protein